MRRKSLSTSLFAIAALAGAAANAQTPGKLDASPAPAQAAPAQAEPAPPEPVPAEPPQAEPTQAEPTPPEPAAPISMAGFLADAIPNANFLEQASRMALGHSKNSKIREYAQQVAKAQTAAANSLTAWVNTSGPVVTTRSAIPGSHGRLSAPRLLPDQAKTLQQLSTLQGRDFDALYISTQRDALLRLSNIYQDYIDKGEDPGLNAIAARELPEIMAAISRLASL